MKIGICNPAARWHVHAADVCLFLRSGYRVLSALPLTWPSHFFPCDFRDPTRLDNFSKGRQRHFP